MSGLGTATLTRGHNYVVSRSFTFPLGRAGPPFGFGFGVCCTKRKTTPSPNARTDAHKPQRNTDHTVDHGWYKRIIIKPVSRSSRLSLAFACTAPRAPCGARSRCTVTLGLLAIRHTEIARVTQRTPRHPRRHRRRSNCTPRALDVRRPPSALCPLYKLALCVSRIPSDRPSLAFTWKERYLTRGTVTRSEEGMPPALG